MCMCVNPDILSFQMCTEVCSEPCKCVFSVYDSRRSVGISDANESSRSFTLFVDGVFRVSDAVILSVRFQIAGERFSR